VLFVLKPQDGQVCRKLHYNPLYRWFCHLGWQDPLQDGTILVVFRWLLGADGFHRLF